MSEGVDKYGAEYKRTKNDFKIRRLERYKTGKTYHGIIKAASRRYRRYMQEITTPLIYYSTDTGLQGMNITEAARRLMFADPAPSVPGLFILETMSDADEWQKASNKQWPEEWNPGGGKK